MDTQSQDTQSQQKSQDTTTSTETASETSKTSSGSATDSLSTSDQSQQEKSPQNQSQGESLEQMIKNLPHQPPVSQEQLMLQAKYKRLLTAMQELLAGETVEDTERLLLLYTELLKLAKQEKVKGEKGLKLNLDLIQNG